MKYTKAAEKYISAARLFEKYDARNPQNEDDIANADAPLYVVNALPYTLVLDCHGEMVGELD